MTDGPENVQSGEVSLTSQDMSADLDFYTKRLGFRLETIFPADDPSVAVLSGHGLRVRLERGSTATPAVLRILCRDPAAFAAGERELTAPNGVRIEVVDATPRLEVPATHHAFVVSRMKTTSPWVIGRAGMQYRDLLPGRLGGSIIASHIRIPGAGPVPDMVHFHEVRFQLIFCHRGWVRVVYEDQGPPFVLKAGDCVIQPPRIRHRVLESSENLHVVEVGVPAEHITTVDHEMNLPTSHLDAGKVFGGQTFCRSEVQAAVWEPWRLRGFEARDTGIAAASAGVASVKVARPSGRTDGAATSHADGAAWSHLNESATSHTADILFAFLLSGSMTLRAEGQGVHALEEGDAYTIPPGMKTALSDCSQDLQLLEVSLPARFETIIAPESDLH